ncbi:RNase adapter RapZ [Helicovermis profundi]|uniref:RNase adapter RapZ n=1 Tax=Helicovermis profundi TaxID=3065157 RepID=A0AAU9EAD8_9FIRM|nr:RNase adapter RapZ [Clostridia bacterium S502]
MKLTIITGLSGAGRSQAMKAMEDIGYYCIDNLPPIFIPKFMDLISKNIREFSKVALVIDIRGGKFFDELYNSLDYLKNNNIGFDIIFLEANNKVLLKRFKEARRTHPLLPEGSIEEGIEKEKEKLYLLREMSHIIIDTSNLNISNFKKELYKYYLKGEKKDNMSISVVSFGFKKGIPLDSDMVFDVRMLQNPYYIEELKYLTGNDKKVQNYVMKFPESIKYFERIVNMVDFLIPQCLVEGRTQFVIAIGCTGGQHRSVTFANKLYDYLRSNNREANLLHRELANKKV